ncbi:hypothetical protein DQ04_09061010 [Trypanosoma grayi]|uniref:hypothetical protein n=1 Tax=Trypanosoma grayi TaxID=71804 RepID=UPI0004F488C3|nr:hypothetical protein DQ04_09061010 [Trypanosoma grayi]KEG07694.1 hypothetical protein DQ04_09061010 [Trypanosoma grayi]
MVWVVVPLCAAGSGVKKCLARIWERSPALVRFSGPTAFALERRTVVLLFGLSWAVAFCIGQLQVVEFAKVLSQPPFVTYTTRCANDRQNLFNAFLASEFRPVVVSHVVRFGLASGEGGAVAGFPAILQQLGVWVSAWREHMRLHVF